MMTTLFLGILMRPCDDEFRGLDGQWHDVFSVRPLCAGVPLAEFKPLKIQRDLSGIMEFSSTMQTYSPDVALCTLEADIDNFNVEFDDYTFAQKLESLQCHFAVWHQATCNQAISFPGISTNRDEDCGS